VNVTGREWIKACLMTLVDRYESNVCGEITGIRKQVVASLLPTTVQKFAWRG